MDQGNGLKRFNRWIGIIISLVAILSMLIGGIAGMTIKSQKIEEAYECSKENEQAIKLMREEMVGFMSEIRTDLKYIVKELDKRND